MLINSKEIINIINKKKREKKIYKCASDLNTPCIVALFGEDNSRLIAGVRGIGNSEYGVIVYWDEELTEMDTLHIKNCIKMIYRSNGNWRHGYLRLFENELRRRKYL